MRVHKTIRTRLRASKRMRLEELDCLAFIGAFMSFLREVRIATTHPRVGRK